MAISKVSFFKTPQANDDWYYWNEETLQADTKVYNATTGCLTLDVMANDLGGNAKTLYSIDDGNGNPINPTDLFNVDTLVNGVSAWEQTTDGNRARINNGKVEFDLSNELPGGVNSLGAGDQFTDTFIYAIRLGNGTLSWAHVHITIDGVNDSATITASGNEDTSVTEAGGVANGTAGDPDASGQLTVNDVDTGENKFQAPASLDGTYGAFKFDADTGAWSYSLDQSKADALFDGEAASDSLKVTSFDGTATYEIKVDITGSNDAPVAKDDTDTATEDGPVVNGSVATNDGDVDAGATLTYSLDAPVAGLTLNADGSYSFDASHVDYQHLAAGKSIDVVANYTVTDDKGATDGGTLTITVTGVNDAPTITSNDGGDEATISIAENTSAVTKVTATDPDDGTTLEYKISGGADSALFAIDKNTGALSFIAAPNFESPADTGTDNVYDVVVQAWDGLAGDSQTLHVTITDVNETPGAGIDFAVKVDEDVSDTAVLATVTGTDPDLGGGNDGDNDFENLSYEIAPGGDPYGLFEIDAATGEVSLKTGAAFDFETTQSYVVTVRVSDGPGLFDDTKVTISITDVNEAPTMTVDATPVSAGENTAAGTALADVDGTDPDLGGGNDGDNNFEDLTYAITAGNAAGLFAIDAATGEISLAAGKSFDFEAAQQYVLTVRVTDGPGLFEEKTVTINVTDVNEAPSLTVDATPVSLAENTAAGTVLADVDGTDPDVGGGNDGDNDFGDLTYAITAGNAAGLFAIDAATGEISLAAGKSFDFESAQQHVLTVRVTDGPGLLDEKTVTINVTDVNEAPSLTVDTTPVNAAEDTVAGAVLADVDGTDPDLGGGNDGVNNFEDLTYSITAGNAAGLFAIDVATGEISLAPGKSFDFEAAQQYVLTVRVTDGPGLFDEKTVTINVTDVNEAPTLTVDATPVSVAEDAAAGTLLADVDGTDPDLGGGNDGANNFENLTYSITAGDAAGLFAIDAATGEISLAAGKSFDLEATQQYVLTVRVTDDPGLFDEKTVTIDVTDVNEAPTLTVDATPVSVAENAAIGTVVGDVDGTDPDVGGENDGANDFENLKYSIVSVDGFTSGAIYSLFLIDGATGTVSLAGALDYETDQSYSLVIKVADGPGLFDQKTLVVNVTDVAEADPNDFDNDSLVASDPDTKATDGDDALQGGAGNDSINGKDGNDEIYGGAGNDALVGGKGNDTIYAQAGPDGGVNGNEGNDTIYGGSGNDDLNGNDGNDTIYGGSGDDSISGNNGLDGLYGGSGADTIVGGNDGDLIVGGYGGDTLTGNNGTDTFTYLSLFDGKDVVTDFDTAAGGDILDIGAVLDLGGNTWTDGNNLSFAVTNGYVAFTNVGGATQVNVDIDGTGSAFTPAALVVLTGVNPATAATDLSDNIVLG
jgi:protocadherin Fat 4